MNRYSAEGLQKHELRTWPEGGRKGAFSFCIFIVEIHLQHLLHVNKSPISNCNKINPLNVLQEQRCVIF